MDEERLEKLGWEAGIGLEEGLLGVYGWFCDSHNGNIR
jgi:hypothetical protein